MKILKLLMVSIPILIMASCGSTEMKSIRTASIEMQEEYPMEGSNTLTGIWQTDLNGITIDQIESAKVTAIKLRMIEPAKTDALEGVIMQLAATGTDMQRVGVLNPIPADQAEVELSVAAEQENLLDLLKQKEITFVADINLSEEPSAGIHIAVEIEFELEVKQ